MDIDWNAIGDSGAALLARYGLSIAGGILIAIVGWGLAGWIGRAVERAARGKERLGPTVAPMTGKAARIVVLLVVLIAVLDSFGVDTSALLAAVGAIGLGVGLALKDTISDLAAGVLLLVLRPFEVGDAVDLVGDTSGTVESIDLFSTRIIGFDGVPAILPNRSVRDGVIKNFSRAERRRIDLTVGVAYDADLERAVSVIRDVVEADARIVGDPEPLIDTSALADSSVHLLVRVWTAPDDFLATSLELHRRIKSALDEAGIGIPFPQREIRIIQATAS